MIRYNKKLFIFNISETWFNYEYSIWNFFKLNVFMHVKNAEHKKKTGKLNISYTLELDLEQDTTVIFSNFSKQIRQQAKIAENEGTLCYFHREIEKFADFFNDFAIKKETFTTSKEKILELGDSVQLSFAENNGQVLAAHSYLVDQKIGIVGSYVQLKPVRYFLQNNGQDLAAHSYLVDQKIGIVRHLHSATKRLDEQFDRNLIGRANKYLTVKDILYFKEQGYKIFDFGGFAKDTEDESLKGINNYKLLFGGQVVPCYNYYSYGYSFLKNLSKVLGLSGKL